MKPTMEQVSDVLVNQMEHCSQEEAISSIMGSSNDQELKEQVTVMVSEWVKSESIAYWLCKTPVSAESNLRKFIIKHLGQYVEG